MPGANETYRVNGRARVSMDADLKRRFAVNGKEPATVMVVTVEQAFQHCPKALVRSDLWNASKGGRPQGVPTQCVRRDDASFFARHERFRESELFRRVFERVVETCIAAGLVGGEGFAVDASLSWRTQTSSGRYRARTGTTIAMRKERSGP